MGELDLPPHAKLDFPDPENLKEMKIIIDLTKEETIWRGAKYEFALELSANYPNEAPKTKCIT